MDIGRTMLGIACIMVAAGFLIFCLCIGIAMVRNPTMKDERTIK